MNVKRICRTFVFTCPQCGKMMFADEIARGRIQGCPYCGGRTAIPKDARSGGVLPTSEVRIAAENEGVRRLFNAAPWQIRACVLWMMFGGIITWPNYWCGGWWLLLLGVGIGLPFSMLFAWMLLKWNWFRWLVIVGGIVSNAYWLVLSIVGVYKFGWGPAALTAVISQSLMSIFMALLLLRRSCSAWYSERYVGVMQPPPGKRRPMLLFITLYITVALVSQFVLGPIWSRLDGKINEKTCPIAEATLDALQNQPKIGMAYLFTVSNKRDSSSEIWTVEPIISYSRIYWRTGTLAQFRYKWDRERYKWDRKFEAFLYTHRDPSLYASGLSGVYVCCGSVKVNGKWYVALREMNEKIARRRLEERVEALRKVAEKKRMEYELAEKGRLLELIRETAKAVATRTSNINRILAGYVYEGFSSKEALRVDPFADVKREGEPKSCAVSADTSLAEIEAEQKRLDGEVARLDTKLRKVEACYKEHKRRVKEEAVAEAKRRAAEAIAEGKRRAEEEARELESRKERCSPCGGTGTVDCAQCKGQGTVIVYKREPCPVCDDSERKGYVIRRVTCDRCRGSGLITPRCDTCGGKGRVRGSDRDSMGRLRLDTREICSSCGGTGKGDRQSCPKCFDSAGKVGVWQRCEKCRGTGKVLRGNRETCTDCDGKCKTECERCNGKGFTYRPKQ